MFCCFAVDLNKFSLRSLAAMNAGAKKGQYDVVTDKGKELRPENVQRFNTDGPGNIAELERDGFPDPVVQPKKGDGKVVGPKPGRPAAELKSAQKPSPADRTGEGRTEDKSKKAGVPKGRGPKYTWKPPSGGNNRSRSAPSTGKRGGGPSGASSGTAKKQKVPNTWVATEAEVADLSKLFASEMAEEMRLMSRRVSVLSFFCLKSFGSNFAHISFFCIPCRPMLCLGPSTRRCSREVCPTSIRWPS